MKISILTHGSRGDVQPFLALAVGLQKAGHSVLLAAPYRFANFIEQYNVSFAALPGNPEQLSALFNNAGQNPFRVIRSLSQYVFEIAPDVIRVAVAACADAECIIHSFLFTAGGYTIACQHGVPDISIQTFPIFAPTTAFPNVAVAKLPPGWLSYTSHWFFDHVFRYGGNSGYARIRRAHPDLPLSPTVLWPFTPSPARPHTPLLFAFSQSVIPPPPEWQKLPHLHIPGYLFLEDNSYQPPQLLTDFLAGGRAPVCITFGSMINRDMEHIRTIVLEALQRTHQRAIILTGWGEWGISSTTKADILTLESASHEWLFPRCKLVIHHGGAGTTAAALRSGVPSLVIPLAGDQLFWAKRVDFLGVGPASITLKRLSAEKLAQALIEADSPAFRVQAEKMGVILRSENGVGTSVRLIEEHARRFKIKIPISNLKDSKLGVRIP